MKYYGKRTGQMQSVLPGIVINLPFSLQWIAVWKTS